MQEYNRVSRSQRGETYLFLLFFIFLVTGSHRVFVIQRFQLNGTDSESAIDSLVCLAVFTAAKVAGWTPRWRLGRSRPFPLPGLDTLQGGGMWCGQSLGIQHAGAEAAHPGGKGQPRHSRREEWAVCLKRKKRIQSWINAAYELGA